MFFFRLTNWLSNKYILLFVCQTGRVDPHQPRVCGHSGRVLDIKWNPFDDYCIASCSEDCTVWSVFVMCYIAVFLWFPSFVFDISGLNNLLFGQCLFTCWSLWTQVKIWDIPVTGVQQNLTRARKTLIGHSRRVGLIEWHPTAENLLLSSAYDYKVRTPYWCSESKSLTVVGGLMEWSILCVCCVRFSFGTYPKWDQ